MPLDAHPPAGNIRLAREADRGASVALIAETFGTSQLQKARLAKLYGSMWTWKFQRNPDSDVPAPTLLVYERDGRPLGQRGMMPFYLLAHGQTTPASWGVDFAVDFACQGQGIGSALLQRWFADMPVCAALGSTPRSVALYRKQGLVEIAPVLYMVRLLRPLRSVCAVNGVRRKLVLLRGWGQARAKHDVGARSDVDVEPSVPDASWGEALEDICQSYEFIARRTVPWLQWRFVEHPLCGYVLLAARRNQGLRGYAAVRMGVAYGGLPSAIIGDLLFASDEPEVGAKLIASSIELAERSGLHAVVARASHGALVSLLREAGFFARPTPVTFFVNLSDNVPRDAATGLSMASKWHITMADSDAEAMVPGEI